MRFAFTFTIFVGAFLLFLVQPMFARMMLPKLGGSPSVWNTAMVFYQAALLAGYAYAHFSIRKLGTRRQSMLHLGFICLPLFVLPIGISHGLTPPQTSNPVLWMLGLMSLSVGLPFLLISTTSPLMQRWFHATGDRQAHDPYFLYAASNAGSLLALLSYPTLIEPNFPLEEQSRIWSWGYGLLIACVFWCNFLLRNATKNVVLSESPAEATVADESITAARRVRWVLLALVPSSLMLSVTTYLTTDIAAVPLLWIIPLTLYLLTFIFVFAARPPLPHSTIVRAFPILLLPLVIIIAGEGNTPLLLVMSFHLLAFFLICMACHGELARDRPAPTHLTEFYLLMSLGGVLGGAFTSLLSPVLFRSLAEYPLVLVLACFLIIPAAKNSTARSKALDLILPCVIGLTCALLILALQAKGLTSNHFVMGVMFGIPTLAAFPFSRRPIRFGLAIAAVFLAANLRVKKDETIMNSTRSFFGAYRVLSLDSQTGTYHQFMHGTTLHGQQSLDPKRRREPLTYYTESGPLGMAIDSLQARLGAGFDSAGVIGLGVGTAATYATPKQHWTFYEIDPVVRDIAENPDYFTYLRDCKAPYEVVIGDGRLQLKNAPDAGYDLLVLDAYSSDSLPIHLLTREALELYASKIAPGGVMIFNISNRHLDLEPQMAALAQSIGWKSLICNDLYLDETKPDTGKTMSQWVLLGRQQSDLGKLVNDKRWKKLKTRPDTVPWTDGYSSLLSAFAWR